MVDDETRGLIESIRGVLDKIEEHEPDKRLSRDGQACVVRLVSTELSRLAVRLKLSTIAKAPEHIAEDSRPSSSEIDVTALIRKGVVS